jgi:hypothetical protein
MLQALERSRRMGVGCEKSFFVIKLLRGLKFGVGMRLSLPPW